ncbi:MAG: enoyl-CoA hydratase/isomerase family protein [Planctomycetota bacterium]|nr:enoyl-CoA hydratase/isomerase family protein [Planctomycetota bacterium]
MISPVEVAGHDVEVAGRDVEVAGRDVEVAGNMSDANESLCSNVRGRVGHLHVNRPQALNALTLEMVQGVIHCLDRWAKEDRIESVLITGEGERAFCAGVDVKSLYAAEKPAEPGCPGTLSADLFRFEYTMDHRIATFPKPYVAFWDGVVMGGGVGVSIMGSHRIATDRTRFAMPETGIGLFPDIGAGYFLSRLGPLGKLIGLTGLIVDGAAAVELGLATHFVPYENGNSLLDSIVEQGIESSLEFHAGNSVVSDDWKLICEVAERCFETNQIECVFQSLEKIAAGDSGLSTVARDIVRRLGRRSPTSLKLTLEQFRRGATMSYDECLVMEYRLSQACLQRDDFYEGVRAVLIDKDHSPCWDPQSVQEVDDADITACFESLAEYELVL